MAVVAALIVLGTLANSFAGHLDGKGSASLVKAGEEWDAKPVTDQISDCIDGETYGYDLVVDDIAPGLDQWDADTFAEVLEGVCFRILTNR